MVRQCAGRLSGRFREIGDRVVKRAGWRLPAGREVGAWGSERAMCGDWEPRIKPKPANRNNSLPMLRDAEVCGIHLAQMDEVPRTKQWLEEISNIRSPARRQKPLDILEHKGFRAVVGDDRRKRSDKRVSVVISMASARGGKALARWASGNYIAFWEARRRGEVELGDMIAEVAPECCDGGRPIVERPDRLETCVDESESEPASPGEEIYDFWSAFGHATS